MLLNMWIFNQKGNSIFSIIPAIAYDVEDSKAKNKKVDFMFLKD